jgi:hypothetical protein
MSSGTVLAAYAPARTAGRTQLEATVMRRGKLRKVHVAFAAATVLGQGSAGSLAAILIAGASIAVSAVTAAVLVRPNPVAAS